MQPSSLIKRLFPFFAFCICVLLFWPGLMRPDSIVQMQQGIAGGISSDFHPPMMGFLWGLLDKLYRGSGPMFLFHLSLYWGAASLFAFAQPQKAKWVNFIAILPPVFAYQLLVIKEHTVRIHIGRENTQSNLNPARQMLYFENLHMAFGHAAPDILLDRKKLHNLLMGRLEWAFQGYLSEGSVKQALNLLWSKVGFIIEAGGVKKLFCMVLLFPMSETNLQKQSGATRFKSKAFLKFKRITLPYFLINFILEVPLSDFI